MSERIVVNRWTEITTDLLDCRNDYIQIYYLLSGNEYTIFDDGYCLRELSLRGVNLRASDFVERLSPILALGKVELRNGDELIATATLSDFGERKRILLLVMLAIEGYF